MEITIPDLLLAYRKAKVDMYYSGMPCRDKLADFEGQLEYEIRTIQKLLCAKDKVGLKELCKGYLLVPKKVSFKKDAKQPSPDFDASIVFSDPVKEYSEERMRKCQLRLMSDLPVAFHVIMTWWIIKIGEKLERGVSKRSLGNRIRRKADDGVSEFSTGTFIRYLHQYHKWRDDGIKVIHEAIENEKKDVLAITADFTAFYHTISPDFLLDEKFYELLDDVSLAADELEYTELIVWMIKEWAGSTPLERGLPVGCSISAVMANLSLCAFDKKIEREVLPLYYGRYVDDIIIIIENTGQFADSRAVWNWLARRIEGLDVSELNQDSGKDRKAKRIYYHDKIVGEKVPLTFESEKTKVFIIDHQSGGLLLSSLERQIKSRSSEWRALPDFPDGENEMTSKILSACNATGEEVDNLRKVDVLSLKRAVFAMAVRDFESYGRNLTPDGWRKVRLMFLNLIDKHFTDVKSFFDLNGYFPRIIATACNCMCTDDLETEELIVSIAEKLFRVIRDLNKNGRQLEVSGGIKISSANGIAKLREYTGRMLAECIASAANDTWVYMRIRDKLNKRVPELEQWLGISRWEEFYAHDLAYQPARTAYTKERIGSFNYDRSMYGGRAIRTENFLPDTWVCAANGFRRCYSEKIQADVYTGDVDISLIFPTRPISTFEITKLFWNPYAKNDRDVLGAFLSFERGYGADDKVFPKLVDNSGRGGPVTDFVWSKQNFSVNIALANWLTEVQSFNASVCNAPDPDEVGRYNRLMRLVNEIIASDVRVQYVVFPELSIPCKWFEQIALKLKVSGISFIAGVEYIHEPTGREVRNQVWCSLLHDNGGFPTVSVYKFEKSRAALHESEELFRRGKTSLISDVITGSADVKPIVRHGDIVANRTFDFSTVICSDLTNIDYRTQLRGRIDALFVPSWNQDADVFSSIVESAAYDIHAYVIQCNDRAYGDTRIRAPAKERYNRDIVKIKGGEKDYYVIGRLDVERLRRFQSFPISPTEGKDATFKPIPSGFKIAEERKILPQ